MLKENQIYPYTIWGGILLEILEQTKVLTIEELLYETQNKLKKKLHIDFLYYALDWLFLLSLIKKRIKFKL
mgnify:CR=1 FL=1